MISLAHELFMSEYYTLTLMRSLFLFTAKHNLILSAQHIPGADNGAADALSRNDKNLFLIQVAGARRDPTPIPARSAGSHAAPSTRFYLTELDKVAAGLMAKGIAESTHRVYRST